MANRLVTVVGIISYAGFGYILIVNPAIMAWKNIHPFAGIGWVLLIGVCLYGELTLRERYPNFPH